MKNGDVVMIMERILADVRRGVIGTERSVGGISFLHNGEHDALVAALALAEIAKWLGVNYQYSFAWSALRAQWIVHGHHASGDVHVISAPTLPELVEKLKG